MTPTDPNERARERRRLIDALTAMRNLAARPDADWLHEAIVALSHAAAVDGFERGVLEGLAIASAECDRLTNALDYSGNEYRRPAAADQCSVAIRRIYATRYREAYPDPVKLNELSGNSGKLPPAPAAVAGGVVTEELAAAVLTEYIARRQEDGEGDRFPPELVAQARVDDMRAALNSALAAQPAAGDAVPARIVELADRLVAPGPKAAHVSASECHEIRDFIADLASPTTQRPSVVDDTARLDWIDGQIQCYGDGYTEPREAGWCVQWQQSKPGEYWTNLRDWVDAEMRQTDDLTAALRPESGEA